MKNRKLIAGIAVLAALTAVIAAVYLGGRKDMPKDAVLLSAGGKNSEIAISELAVDDIDGVRVNGKGEEIPVSGKGITLEKFIDTYGIGDFEVIKVTADDAYSAEVNADEAANGAFVLEDDGLRFVMFGDSNSKRSVTNVKEISVD